MRKIIFTLALVASAASAQAMTKEQFKGCTDAARKLPQPEANRQATRCLMQSFIDLKNRNQALLDSGGANARLPGGSGSWIDDKGYTIKAKHGQIAEIVVPHTLEGVDYEVEYLPQGIRVKAVDGENFISFEYNLVTNDGRYLDAKIPMMISASETAPGTKVVLEHGQLIKVLNRVYQKLPQGMSMSHFAAKAIKEPRFRDSLLEIAAKLVVTSR